MFIGDANGKAKKLNGIFFGGANGKAVEAQKGYMGDANGKAQLFYQKETGTPIGDYAIGSTANIPVGGVNHDWIVVQHGKPSADYDDSFIGGTVLLMKKVYKNQSYNSDGRNINNYANSTINAYLNGDFLALVDERTRSRVRLVKVPYHQGTGTTDVLTGANGHSAKVFLLGCKEVNLPNYYGMPVDGATLAYFIGANNAKRIVGGPNAGVNYHWWLRSPCVYTQGSAWFVEDTGDVGTTLYDNNAGDTYGIRPAIVLPSSYVLETGGGRRT